MDCLRNDLHRKGANIDSDDSEKEKHVPAILR